MLLWASGIPMHPWGGVAGVGIVATSSKWGPEWGHADGDEDTRSVASKRDDNSCSFCRGKLGASRLSGTRASLGLQNEGTAAPGYTTAPADGLELAETWAVSIFTCGPPETKKRRGYRGINGGCVASGDVSRQWPG